MLPQWADAFQLIRMWVYRVTHISLSSCISAVKCVEPPHVENGASSITGALLVYNHVITFTCMLGYVQPGGESVTTSTCLADGTWTPVEPCQCKDDVAIEHTPSCLPYA